MLDFIPVVLKNLFSKPATRNYPFETRKPYEQAKGHIGIDIDACIYCGMCSRKCPVQAITVTRAQRTWEIDRFRCIMCGACSESCPKKCLYIREEYTAPAAQKTHDVVVGKPAEPKPVQPAAPKPAEPVAAKPAQPAAAMAANRGAEAQEAKNA